MRTNPLQRKDINENNPHSRIISPPSLHARKDLWDAGSALGKQLIGVVYK